jgi:hypothetical protein
MPLTNFPKPTMVPVWQLPQPIPAFLKKFKDLRSTALKEFPLLLL